MLYNSNPSIYFCTCSIVVELSATMPRFDSGLNPAQIIVMAVVRS